MDYGKISVIVPVYNVENYLKKCLKSIINQTYKNIEIILIDDGSTDNSGIIIDEFKDDRISVIHKNNGGLSSARNVGIEKATGQYLTFVDSDDIVNYKMLEVLIQNLKKFNADISICAFQKVYEQKVIEEREKINNNVTCYDKIESLKELLSSDEKITNHAWCKLYKKELFDNIFYPIKRNFEDVGTTYKLLDKSNIIVYSDFVGYYYLQRKSSITGNISVNSMKDERYLMQERYEYLLKKYQNLEDSLLRNRANFSLLHHTGLAKITDKLEYNSENTKKEYAIFINYVNQFGMKNILLDNSKMYKILAILLRLNRNIFYLVVSILFKVRRRHNK